MALNNERISGRQRGEVYSQLGFELLKNDDRKYAALCLTCNVILKNTAAKRLASHRNVCHLNKWKRPRETESPVDDKPPETENHESNATSSLYSYSNATLIKTEPIDDIILDLDCNNSGEETRISTSNQQIHHQPIKLAKQKKYKISNYRDVITSEDEENFNNALGEFFFGCNIPLSVIESDNFKNFIHILRPSYVEKLPSKKVLSTTILDTVHKNCLTSVKRNIGPESTLLIDGWKCTSNKTKIVVSILYTSSGEREFLNVWNVNSTLEGNEKLAEIVQESEQLALSRFNTKINAVVSDNAVNMRDMEEVTSLWHMTCNLYIIKLLAKDIFKSYSDLFKLAGTITNTFKQPELEILVIQKGGRSITTISDEHLCSYRDNLISLDNNLQYMKEIASDQNFGINVDTEVKFLLFDNQLKSDMKKAFEIIDPICDLILKFQNSRCSLADAVHYWIRLKSSQVYQQFSTEFVQRKELAMNLYALSAYLLDPNYDQSNLEHGEKATAIEFIIRNLTSEGITEFDLYMKKEGFFALLFQKNIKDASVFWNMAMYNYPEISKLARKLLQIPASSVEIDRIFPSWPFVHSSNRNLGDEITKKLQDVYCSLKFCDSSKSDEY